MMVSRSGAYFSSSKARILDQVDLSRKGAIDDAIVPLVEYLNSQEHSYTTSSCSGRIAVFCEDSNQRKKGCHWLLISHEPIKLSQLSSALSSDLPDSGYVYFKFEPFVLHVILKTLEDAQALLQIAVGAGFRNSGITVGRKGKIMLAVRSTHSLEVPLAFNGDIIVSEEYLRHLILIGNSKLDENLQRVDGLFQQVKDVSKKTLGAQGKDDHRQRGKSLAELHALSVKSEPDRASSSLTNSGSSTEDDLFSDHGGCAWLEELYKQ